MEQNITEDKIYNKLIRKKTIWAEIKAKEQEYNIIQKQIDELEQAKKDISFDVQKRLEESQKISEWLDQKEYQRLKDLNNNRNTNN